LEAAAIAAGRLTGIADAIVVTLGQEGALYQAHGKTEHIKPRPVTALDTTGAGDAFVGGLAFGLAARWDPLEAVRLAGAAGAAAVTRIGARDSLPNADQLREMFGLNLNKD
jgi:sugar/nucleoside kinase (ribokinase family)